MIASRSCLTLPGDFWGGWRKVTKTRLRDFQGWVGQVTGCLARHKGGVIARVILAKILFCSDGYPPRIWFHPTYTWGSELKIERSPQKLVTKNGYTRSLRKLVFFLIQDHTLCSNGVNVEGWNQIKSKGLRTNMKSQRKRKCHIFSLPGKTSCMVVSRVTYDKLRYQMFCLICRQSMRQPKDTSLSQKFHLEIFVPV